MDKNTLSHYGWLIIAIIIIALLLGFAIPFAFSIRNQTHDVAGGYLDPDISKEEVTGGVHISTGVPVDIGDSHATSFDYVIGEGVFDTVKIYQNGTLVATFENSKTSGNNVHSFNEGDFVYGDVIKVELYRDGELVGKDVDIYDYATVANYIITINKKAGIKDATLAGYLSVDGDEHVYVGDSQATATATLERGYEFDGWYDEHGVLLSTNAVYQFTVVADIKLTARAKLIEYNINYETNGGVLPADAIQTFTVLDTVVLPSPTKNDYLFEGWYQNSAFSGSPITSFTDEIGDKTYYAKWSPNNLSVTATGYSGVYDGNAHSISVVCESATISYSVDGTNFSTENYAYTDVGKYIVYYKVEKSGHTPVISHEQVEITPANGWVNLSTYSGTLVYPSQGSFLVTDTHPGGQLAVKSANASIVTAIIDGNNIDMVPGVEGETTITVTSSATNNYTKATAVYKVAVQSGVLVVSAQGYEGVYDGQPHYITVNCPGAKITYSATGSGYTGDHPSCVSAGTYPVYYKVEKSGYNTVLGSVNVVIHKAPVEIVLSSYKDTIPCFDNCRIVITRTPTDGLLRVTPRNADVATASLSGNLMNVTANDIAGVAGFEIISEETTNYKKASAYYELTVRPADLSYASFGYSGVYDKLPHGITVNCPGATILYSEDGETYTENNPQYTDAGEYTVYYTITRSGYKTVNSFETVKIAKANGFVALSPTDGSLSYNESASFEVVENLSGGTLSVETENDSIANAVLDGTKVTITSKTAQGKTTITVISAETKNYLEASADYSITVVPGALAVFVNDYEGIYDGQPHGVTVICDGATVSYFDDEALNYTSINPLYTDAGTYTVRYKVEKAGYDAVTGTASVKIHKATCEIKLSEYVGSLTYPTSKQIAITNDHISGNSSAFTVSTSNPAIATAQIDGNTITIVPGTIAGNVEITVTCAETNNYKESTATYRATVGLGELVVGAEGYVGVYDGLPHSITVTCEGANIFYSETGINDYSPINPEYVEVGEYMVYYAVTKSGYETVYGSATVVITPPARKPLALILDNEGDASNPYPMVFVVYQDIKVGETYNGLKVLHVYSGFLNDTGTPWFGEREKVTSVTVVDEMTPMSVDRWFYGFKNCSSFEVSKLDVSLVESFYRTFAYAGYSTSSLNLSSISSWDTQSAVTMEDMFLAAGYNEHVYDGYDFSVDLSSWDVSNVTTVSGMFATAAHYASSVNINVSWGEQTSNLKDISGMFNWLNRYELDGDHTTTDYSKPDPIRTTITILGLENWDTSNVEDMSYFINSVGWHCDSFSIDLSNWKVGSVTNFDYAFDSFGFRAGYASLGDLSKWAIRTDEQVTMNCMFRYTAKRANSFNTLNLKDWDITAVTEMNYFCHESNWIATHIVPPDGIGNCPSRANCNCET